MHLGGYPGQHCAVVETEYTMMCLFPRRRTTMSVSASRVYTAQVVRTWTMISHATVLSAGRAKDARQSCRTASLTPA